MGRSKRGRLVFGVVGCCGLLLTVYAGRAAALQPGCSQSGSTVTCTYAVGDNAFTVPNGVRTLHVVAVGGTGGPPLPFLGTGGGFGARVTGDLSVSPGSTLYAVVGGNGSAYNAGANGGGHGGFSCSYSQAPGGGGASDVRTIDTDLMSRLLVAAGGGGAGCGNGLAGGLGAIAGLPGGPGGPGTSLPNGLPNGATGGLGGLPGTLSAGGAGGAGGVAAPACTGAACPGQSGGAGSLGAGGQGGAGGQPPLCDFAPPGNCGGPGGGGGGGGGLFGGGGGGGGGNGGAGDTDTDGGGGGGGGGSSLVPVGGTISIDATGQPEVVISYV